MGQAESLIEHYLERYEAAESPAEKCALMRQLAAVYENDLGDAHQAFDALFVAFETDPSDEGTAAQLERIAGVSGRWGELIHGANHLLEAEAAPTRRIALCVRLAKWYAEDLGRPEYVQPYYQTVLALDPNSPALRRIAGYCEKAGQ
jgi:tetratricopeptide (TPR) repeat protein